MPLCYTGAGPLDSLGGATRAVGLPTGPLARVGWASPPVGGAAREVGGRPRARARCGEASEGDAMQGDDDFDQLMREEGVRRMGAPAPRKPGPAGAAKGSAAPVAAAAPARPDPRVATLEAELKGLRAELHLRDARLGALERELGAAKGETEAARGQLKAAQQELKAAQHEIKTAALRVDAAERARASAEDRLAEAQRQLAQARAERPKEGGLTLVRPPLGPSLGAALAARGVEPEELGRAVEALGAKPEARSIVEQLVARDADELEGFLERRLALVCGAAACEPQDAAAVLVVSPARCDVCGGSDIQRAAGRFAAACEAHKLARVRVVGGSPAYRTQLEHLFPKGGPLMLLTQRGDKRVSLQRSKRQQASDDLVIVWGATELDHATSQAYRAEFGEVMIVAHRGIARMLEIAAERIEHELGR